MFTEAGLTDEDCKLVSNIFGIDAVRKLVGIFDAADCNTPFRPQMFDKIPEWGRKVGRVPFL